MKYCYQCKQYKNITEFYKNRAHSDGFSTLCKICSNIYTKNYRQRNKEKVRSHNRKSYHNNVEKRRSYRKKYYKENKEKLNTYNRKYNQENKKILNAKANVRRKAKLHYDLNFKIRLNLRNRMHQALKGNYKSGSAVQDLGCSIDEYIKYIEAKFTEGMTWENYGEWHLDHIKPLTSFDLIDRQQFLEAAHYTNYQPLWAEDNLRKGRKEKWSRT